MSQREPEWMWDPTLFEGCAPFYDRGRLPYAPGLADALGAALALDGRGRLLDVGCGPGTVALRCAHLFADVVGLDPDLGMLVEAARIAGERGVANARWLHGRAEELPLDVGSVDVVTFGASFHWMDRPLVARIVLPMLREGGAVVHVDGRHQHALEDVEGHVAVPRAQIDELRCSYLGDGRRAGQSVRPSSPDGESAVFAAAGFVGPETVVVPDGRVVLRSADDLVAEVLSMSSSAPHLFGDRLPAFEVDLRAVLEAAAAREAFAVRLPDNELNIYRTR